MTPGGAPAGVSAESGWGVLAESRSGDMDKRGKAAPPKADDVAISDGRG